MAFICRLFLLLIIKIHPHLSFACRVDINVNYSNMYIKGSQTESAQRIQEILFWCPWKQNTQFFTCSFKVPHVCWCCFCFKIILGNYDCLIPRYLKKMQLPIRTNLQSWWNTVKTFVPNYENVDMILANKTRKKRLPLCLS